MYFDEIIKRVDEVVGHQPKRCENGYNGLCPAHNDKNPSLSLTEGHDGKTLLHCHAGCTTDEICRALGLQTSELFLEPAADKVEHVYTSETGTPHL